MIDFSDYILKNICGEGDDGVVWKVASKLDNSLRALKILRMPIKLEKEEELEQPMEARIMEALNNNNSNNNNTNNNNANNRGHSNIIKYYGWGVVSKKDLYYKVYNCENYPAHDRFFIVMEWIDGMTLDNKLKDKNFGKSKRQIIFKQLLEAIQYMHSLDINHGSIYLNNIIISVAFNNSSCDYKLMLCDFGSSSFLLDDRLKEPKMDQDRCQCGGVLFSLFSSSNLHIQSVTNKLMIKEANKLANDLLNLNKPESLEYVKNHSFINNTNSERFNYNSYTFGNDEIVQNIAAHIISTGDTNDFINASLVCKQFYINFQNQFLCVPQFPHLSSDTGENFLLARQMTEEVQKTVTIKTIQTWTTLQDFSGLDVEFEKELVQSYKESCLDSIVKCFDKVENLTVDKQDWGSILLDFHMICGSSVYVGAQHIYNLSNSARSRARTYLNGKKLLDSWQLEDEKLLFYRFCSFTQLLILNFLKDAKIYFSDLGFDFEV